MAVGLGFPGAGRYLYPRNIRRAVRLRFYGSNGSHQLGMGEPSWAGSAAQSLAAGSRAQAGLGKGRAAWAVLAARALAVGPEAQADWAVGRPQPGRFWRFFYFYI